MAITLAQMKEALTEALHPIHARLDTIEARFDTMQTRFDTMEARFDTMESRVEARFDTMQTRFDTMEAKQRNASMGRRDLLAKILCADGKEPEGPYPKCLGELLVAGNEALPDGGSNQWSSRKSKALLLQYDPSEVSDGEESDGGTHELSGRSRDRRLRLARHLGITRGQLNFAQLAL